MRVCLIRHGSTSWNEEGRIQGQTDITLSDLGRAQVRSWRLPEGFAGAACVSSPLARARETAALMGLTEVAEDVRLAEMDWGGFEGRTLAELRAELGQGMTDLEAAGLDFRPPGGECPRLVAERLAACLHDVAATGCDHILLTHKGVLRASLVLAFGWNMLGQPPVRFEPERALIYELGATGELEFVAAPPLSAQS
jgi:broad specificity phosphatase PhoE